SDDIRLAEVVTRVLDLAVENAGAARGVLLLADPDGLRIVAQTDTESGSSGSLESPTPLLDPDALLPISVLRWVERTGEALVLEDAGRDRRFVSDPFLSTSQPRSVMCLPMIKRGRLIGLLYLENQLSAGSFTRDRLSMVELLSAQAASALENARLYDQLRTSEVRWRSLVEQLPDHVVLVDGGGALEYVNRGTRRDHSLFDLGLLDPDTGHREVAQALARVFTDARYEALELRAGATDLACWYAVRMAPIIIDGRVERVIVVATDISERKRAEIERAKLEAQLRQQQRLESIGTLASGVAHEINNPIQGIMNYAELILDSPAADETICDFASEVRHETERVATIVRNLLAFSRQEQHSQQPDSVSVRALV